MPSCPRCCRGTLYNVHKNTVWWRWHISDTRPIFWDYEDPLEFNKCVSYKLDNAIWRYQGRWLERCPSSFPLPLTKRLPSLLLLSHSFWPLLTGYFPHQWHHQSASRHCSLTPDLHGFMIYSRFPSIIRMSCYSQLWNELRFLTKILQSSASKMCLSLPFVALSSVCVW